MTNAAVVAPRTLADALPHPSDRTLSVVRDVALVVGFSVLTAVAAQFSIHLGFTPVPITGQTFVVLLSGTALGWQRGLASQALYWIAGLAMPFAWYSEGTHGWSTGTGSTAGYLFGFVVAAGLVGYLAERRQDRNLATSIPAMLAGTAVIYFFGVLWLAYKLNVPIEGSDGANAIAYGVTPFLVGDLFKLIVAGALTPLAWNFIDKRDEPAD